MGSLAEKLAAAQSAEAQPSSMSPLHDLVAQHKRVVTGTRASTLEPTAIRWLWESRIALAALALLLGEEGLGKTTLAMRLVAMLTTGSLPGEYLGTPQDVLIASAEDARTSVLVPRLMAAGADLDRVTFVDVKVGEHDGGLEFPKDAEQLASYATKIDAKLVVLDPLVSFLDEKTDSHNDKGTRYALRPLAAAAEAGGFALLGIIHPNKSRSTSERERSMGSVAFRAAARTTLVFGLDPDDASGAQGPSRVLAPAKNNYAVRASSQCVTIESADVPARDGASITTSRAVLGDFCSHTAADIFGAEAAHERADKRTTVGALLEGALPATVGDLKALAETHGIGWRTFERAKAEMGIVSLRTSMADGGAGGWQWSFPPDHGPAI
jgi:putative DNA primase/helicase